MSPLVRNAVPHVKTPSAGALPLHDHTREGRGLRVSEQRGPVLFTHDQGEMTRPATKAGSFRLYKAIKESHTVSNPNDVPSEFRRVEFETQPLDEDSF